MKNFDVYKRSHNINWSLLTIKTLYDNAISKESTTYISYAALECRILIERMEYEILEMIAIKTNYHEWDENIIKFKGINKVNKKLNVLKRRYQLFSEAYSSIINPDYSIKAFNFSKAEHTMNELAKYIHIHTIDSEYLCYQSEFMRAGLNLIWSTREFIIEFLTPKEYGYIFGTLDFSTFKNSDIKDLFDSWLKGVDEDLGLLKEELKLIKDRKEE